MPDTYPHVVSLIYHIGSQDKFRPEAQSVGTLGAFRYELHGNIATFWPEVVYSSQADAETALRPLLEAWEASALLCGIDMRFWFSGCHVREAPPAPNVLEVHRTSHVTTASDIVWYEHIRGEHPLPLANFKADDLTMLLLERYTHSLADRKVVTTNAYRILTKLRSVFGTGPNGSDAPAALALNIHPDVFAAIRKVAHDLGDEFETRKHTQKACAQLTEDQRRWILDAMRQLALRAGQRAAAGVPPAMELALSDVNGGIGLPT